MEQYILKTDKLTKIFGSHKASDSISINVRKGAIYGLIGRNGAGKTTLMKMITGLSNPTSGSYSVKEYSGTELKNARRFVGSLIEAPGLYPDMTAFQNLKCKCLQCGIKDDERIMEVLSLVGLSGTGKKKTAKFSYGMKQRLGIAMSLIDRPELLVLDEPLNGLDPQGIHEFREMLLNLNQNGITLIISSHILDELAKIATDYGIIHKGRLVEETTAEELLARCESKVIIRTSGSEKAANILDRTSIRNFTVHDGTIEIHGHIDETGRINSALVSAGIVVDEIYVKSESLEDHYLRLTGGNES